MCTLSIEGQRPFSSPSWILSGWAVEAAPGADGAMPWHSLFTDVAGNCLSMRGSRRCYLWPALVIFPPTSKVEHHRCWETWKYRTQHYDTSFFAASSWAVVIIEVLISAFIALPHALLSFFLPPGSQFCFPSFSFFLTSPITCVCRTDLRIWNFKEEFPSVVVCDPQKCIP